MKYLSLPLQLLKFWYPESLVIFLRVWHNAVLYLEEDLAVGLMWRLLFVPLFHDSSFVGRLLSFFFRGFRIIVGLITFALVSLILFLIALYWFLTPLMAFMLRDNFGVVAKVLVFAGVVLFVRHIVAHPPKKVWQIKKLDDLWKCSLVKKSDLDLVKLLKTPRVQNLLLYLEQTPTTFSTLAANIFPEVVLQRTWDLGKRLVVPYLGPEHFFVAMLESTPNIYQQLLKLDLSLEDFFDALDFLKRKEETWRMVHLWDEEFRVRHLKGINRGWLGVPTPSLDTVSEDLTRWAGRTSVPDFVGRPEVVSRVINTLSLEQGRNVVLVGEPGSGRGALVSYLAKLIVSGDAPASLATKRLIRLDETKLLAGIQTQGELAQRVKDVFEEVQFSGNIIVFVDEIQNMGLGEVGSEFNLYSLLLPYIEGSTFQFIATTENSNYTRILEKNGSFARLFAKIELPPASESETVDILKNQAIEHERYKKIRSSLLAIKSMAKLTSQYVHDRVLPDSALQVFEQSLVVAEDGWIKKATVEKVIQQQTSIPVGSAGVEVKGKLLNLENIIHQKMIDQEEAVSAVARTLRRAAAELRDTKRPIGSFLFVGPTGVGKTELAKNLAESYFQGQGNFFRLDMSEFQTPDAINRLIGDINNEGLLTETIRQKPYSLILLDEFEKADPKVLTLFLQVLDDGRLTSASGRVVDFTNTIIIATSNAASLTIVKGIENRVAFAQIETQVKEELLLVFKPELVNRFDEVVIFKPLAPLDLQKVVQLKLAILQKQLQDQGYLVDFAAGVIQKLVEKGYDPILGARPLRRLIQDTLEARLSVMILENKLPKGERFIVSEQLLV
ncbi:MAG: ATP-dependent Clp protease ATP-binding subunit [Patescibacteria group bacterium]|nr:ATP-dependent Clp protease ATP-binding subunit [Patescibacteria group bacterium]